MTIDDPKFTAYALNSLLAEEKDAIEPGILADKALWNEAEATAAFAEKLKTAFAIETNARLSSAHWREIYSEAGPEEMPIVLPFEHAEKQPRIPTWPVAAAAGILIGAGIASLAITWSDPAQKFTATLNPTPPEPAKTEIQKTPPAPASNPKPKRTQTSPIIPRPTTPPVVAGTNIGISVKAILIDTEPTPDEEIVEELPLPFPLPNLPMLAAEPDQVTPPAPMRTPRGYSPGIAAQIAPKTTPQKIATAPTPLVKTTAPVIASLPSAPKRPVSLLAFNAEPKKPATRHQQNARTASTATTQPEAIAANASILPILDPSRFNTLDQLNTIFVAEPTLNESLLGLVFTNTFSLRSNTSLKINVILDNGGIPIEFTPPDARVLDISEPFFSPGNP